MKKILIVLDPGHYGEVYNKGVINGYYESSRMYKLSQYEKKALKKLGFDVIMTRDKVTNPSLSSRGLMAVHNTKDYDEVVFISNHSNAVVGNNNACGVLAYRSCFLPGSNDLITRINKSIVEVMSKKTKVTYNRGVFTNKNSSGYDYLGVIRSATNFSTSVESAKKNKVNYVYLIEHGFHTNEKECNFLLKNSNLKLVANAVANTIYDYFK